MSPVKTFWVEPCGRSRVHYLPRGAIATVVDGEYSEARASERMSELMSAGAEHAGSSPLYRLPDGREVPSGELPPGATFNASWWADFRAGEDGMSIVVVTPDGHHWMVDDRASNCTIKDDNVHRCWCRHGDPRAGTLHVDKIGVTCQAGAGSIQTPKWHGFLTHGMLQESR